MLFRLVRNKVLVTLVAVSFATGVRAQHTVSTRNLFWGSVVFNYKFNDRWTLVNDGLFRFETTDGDIFQSGLRSGLQYKNALGVQFTTGGCVFLHYSNPNGKPSRPELRPWQEAGRKFDFGIHHSFLPRIRFEQRFFREYVGDELAEKYTFHSWRLRFRAEYNYFIGDSGRRKWSFVIGDEIMFHRRGNGFTSHDQNRVWVGCAFKVNPAFTAQLTYLHIYQQRTSMAFDQFHVIRLTLQLAGQKHT
jgi:hypothetical protein